MLKPKEDYKYLQDRFENAMIIIIFPFLALVEYINSTGKAGKIIATFLTGLFFWIGVGYSGHLVIKYLVEKFIHS